MPVKSHSVQIQIQILSHPLVYNDNIPSCIQ